MSELPSSPDKSYLTSKTISPHNGTQSKNA
jgi:hypothetical protein